jgi:hypothetical protein
MPEVVEAEPNLLVFFDDASLSAAGRKYFCTMIEADNGFLPLSRKSGRRSRHPSHKEFSPSTPTENPRVLDPLYL